MSRKNHIPSDEYIYKAVEQYREQQRQAGNELLSDSIPDAVVIRFLRKEISKKDEEIGMLKSEIDEKDYRIQELQEEIEDLKQATNPENINMAKRYRRAIRKREKWGEIQNHWNTLLIGMSREIGCLQGEVKRLGGRTFTDSEGKWTKKINDSMGEAKAIMAEEEVD